MEEIKIDHLTENQRLDKFIKKYLPNAGTSFLYKMLRKKNIVLNNKKASGKEMLKKNDIISIYFSEETLDKFKMSNQNNEKMDSIYRKTYKQLKNQVSIIFEDTNIMILNKPSGLLSQKSKPSDRSVNEYGIGYLIESEKRSINDLNINKPSICNRLDRNTSGIILFGKTLLGLQTLNNLIKTHQIEKYYRCILQGKLDKAVYLNAYLVKDEKTNKVSISKTKIENASKIETEIVPISYGSDLTYAEIRLITGKTHQIRAHVSSIGHPIIGDYKYGNATTNQYYKEKFAISSQMLHAYRIVFPILEEPFQEFSEKEFKAKLPLEFNRILDKCF